MTSGAATIPGAFVATVTEHAAEASLASFSTRRELTWARYADQACRVASGLAALGLPRGARVALMMRNRPEFHVLDMGVLLAGGTPFSIYNSSPAAQVRYLLGHAGAQLVVVEDQVFLDRVLAVRGDLPRLRHIVTVDEIAGSGLDCLADLLGSDPVDLASAAALVRPGDLATIIYTSGTTGDPKGVTLSHTNLLGGVEGYVRALGYPLTGMRTVSALPMAHIAERNATHYFHACMGSHVTDCDDFSRFGAAIASVHPEWLFGTPRLWEKYQAGIEARLAADPALGADLARAREVGRAVQRCRAEGIEVPGALRERWERERSGVVEPLLAPLGLDALRIANSGAAPMPEHTAAFWLELGVPLSDVYGQSEASGTVTWEPHRIVLGTSGRPLPGIEITLAEDGEVLLRGPLVFSGYLDDPARTEEAFDPDGWFRTGDIGRFDALGNLTIVDRKKELIVTSGGKNISPALLESALKESTLIGQACVVGDGRSMITALLVLDPETAPVWARERGLPTVLGELVKTPELLARIEADVAHTNQRFNAVERIRHCTVLADAWLPDSDLLTPTAKLKRRGITARYGAEIEAMYR
jgi:long-chain acyl-CoA synthetase